MKRIPINTNINKFFKQFIKIISPILYIDGELVKLSPMEQKVLSELMLSVYKKSRLPLNDRFKLTFDYDSKQEMIDKIGTSRPVFDNTLYSLRKKGLLVDNKLIDLLIFTPDNFTPDYKLTYEFSIQRD